MNAKNLMTELSKQLEPKYCKDCKFFSVNFMDIILFMRKFGKCQRPGLKSGELDYSVVVGGPSSVQISAIVERQSYEHLDNCGKDGKYWEAK